MLSLPTIAALFSTVSLVLAHSSPARLDSRSVSPRAIACPPPILAQYYPAWTGSQSPGQIDWKRADIAYYFATPTTKDGLTLPVGATLDGLKQFISTAKAKGKRAGLTVGGWNGSQYFSNLVATVKNRQKFANTIKTWVTQYGFSSVSFDWEFIGRQGAGNNVVRTSDAQNMIKFLATLRTTLGAGVTIATDVPASGITGADGKLMQDLSKFAANLDYINLMTYDFYGPWSSTTGAHSALYTCNAGSYSIDQSVKDWIRWGVPACKLVVGIPGYSHRFKTASNKLATTTYNRSPTVSFQPLASPKIDDVTPTTKDLIAQKILSSDLSKGLSGYKRYFDTCTQAPVLFNPSSQIFITYEDAVSFQAKGAYSKQMGLGGIAIYDSTGPTASMMNAVASGLGHA